MRQDRKNHSEGISVSDPGFSKSSGQAKKPAEDGIVLGENRDRESPSGIQDRFRRLFQRRGENPVKRGKTRKPAAVGLAGGAKGKRFAGFQKVEGSKYGL